MRNAALREDMRETILDVANRLMARFGYRKTTMEDVAREADIGKGTIYLYFPSKEELALSCIERINDRCQDRLRAIAASEEAPVERLKRMLVERVLLRFDNVQIYAQSLDDLLAAIRSTFHARRERWLHTEAEIFAGVLRDGVRLGAFECADLYAVAHAMLLATSSLMPFSLSPQELGHRDVVSNKAEAIADLLLKGVLQRTGTLART